MPTDKIVIDVDVDAKDAVDEFKSLNKATDRQESSLKRLKIGYAAVAAVVTGTVAVALGRATRAAIDFEEASSKFSTVFKDVSKEANSLRKELVNSFGLSTRAATELLSSTGDLLSGFGFTGKAALDLSGEVNKLSVDLASFTNAQGGAEAVSQALTKALLGERESLKTYGIAVQEADVQARLLAKGQSDLTGEALRQAKAYATLEIATEQSKNAVGDFARTQDSTANQLKQIKATAEDVTLVFGGILLQSIGPLITSFGKFIKSAEGIKVVDVAAKSFSATIAALGGIAELIFNGIKTNIELIATSFSGVVSAFKALAQGEFKQAFNIIKDTALDTGRVIVGGYQEAGNIIKESFFETADAYKEASGQILETSGEVKDGLIEDQQEVAEEAQNLFEILAEIYKKDRQAFETENGRKRALFEQFFNTIQTLTGGAFDFIAQKRSQDLDDQIKDNEKGLNDDIKRLEKQRDAGVINEEQLQKGIEKARAASDKEQRKIKKQAFEREKKIKIAEIAIQGAVAVLTAFAQLGPIGGAYAAIGIGASQVAQTAIVSSQKFPGFQDGTNDAPSGPAIVGENGPELLIPGSGSQIIPNDVLRGAVSNNSTTNDNSTININVESDDPIQFVNRLRRQYGIDIFARN